MSQADPSGSARSSVPTEGRERGAKRKKVYGYLKAANELRHSYQSQRTQQDEAEQGLPGAFPDVEIVRKGDEEMVLFPSYARKHIKKRTVSSKVPAVREGITRPDGSGDAEYWKREWKKYEDDSAIVDVDVRGWIYSPHRGPLTRRHRLLIAVARRLSGVPAPSSSPAGSRGSSQQSIYHDRNDDKRISHEEEIAEKEAQSILRRGEGEADAAWRGSYSEEPDKTESPYSSRPPSPVGRRDAIPGQISRQMTELSMTSDNEDPRLGSLAKRKSWNQPSEMSREELQVANAHLMARLKPFMNVPLTNTPITVFFFNEYRSQSRSINTDEWGHFSLRACLDFVPISVRVLASENLSATEDVIVIEPQGISLVSDIDDTIKHSAIARGAKEIFKNTFIRDLADLTIHGVREWYSKLFAMGVKLHYVSNSPWQLYPLLRSYFALAGLPPGSFHLKQYSGMLQGIFEPAAERKKGSLEKILRDFPERRFILVGDSGEADLEVYTDVVIANPGKVLGVFIRDVTTSEKKRFFDHTEEQLESDLFSGPRRDNASSRDSDESDAPDDCPRLPERETAKSAGGDHPQSQTDKLIDLDETSAEPPKKQHTHNADICELQQDGVEKHTQAPARPQKPRALSSSNSHPSTPQRSQNSDDTSTNRETTRKSAPPPPKPRRPSTSVSLPSTYAHSHPPRVPFSSERQHQARPNPPNHAGSTSSIKSSRTSAGDDEGYAASARRQLASAYNNLPTARSLWNGQSHSPPPSGATNGSRPVPSRHNTGSSRDKPTVPQRKSNEGIAANLTSYPAAAAQSVTNRLSWGAGTGGGAPAGGGGAPAPPLYNKKEEMWKRRWSRAEELMKQHKVVLRSWRVGSDVMDECIRLVEKTLEDVHRNTAEKESRSEREHRWHSASSS